MPYTLRAERSDARPTLISSCLRCMGFLLAKPCHGLNMISHRVLFSAALLSAFTAAVHTIGGTYEIHDPLLDSPLAEPISLLLYACWHLVTVTLTLSAVALFWSSRNNRAQSNFALPAFIGLLWITFGLVFIFVALLFQYPSANHTSAMDTADTHRWPRAIWRSQRNSFQYVVSFANAEVGIGC